MKPSWTDPAKFFANPERRVRHDPLCTRGDTGYSNWDFVYAFVLILIGCGLTAWCLL